VGTLYTIPVVVHIVHNGGPENITNLMVQQGIAHINAALANTGAYDSLTGVDTEIELCLASQDPTGAGTSGIVRVQNTLTSLTMETQDLSLKNLSRWDPNRYLNVWLVAEINSNSSGPGVAGYAFLPSAHGTVQDGIVCESRWFGSTTDNSKIMVHEVGHYLGLYHTFQGGCTNLDCTQDGDQVCDTPPDNSTLATSCTNPPNTCTTDDDDLGPNNPFRPVTSGGLGDQPDQVINYMDYGSLSCLSAFTAGQKARMATYLVTTRMSLLSSLGCTSPCASPIVAGFTPSATQVQVGASVSFANATTGATVYAWERNGQVFSTAPNPSLSFAAAGVHEIALTASNGDPSCTRSHRDTVYVECSENASFTATANNVAPGTLVSFTNTSTGIGTTFKWLLDGLPVSTATNWAYTFNTVGGYSVALVQYGANCNDTSLAWQVTVGACQSKRANNWYFGQRAAVEFSSGGPLPLFNASPFYVGFEACATISDTLGNLLFYTDGATVYNRNHVMMQNGDNLRANASNTQGALIIPKPGSAKDYYLFTQASPGVSPNFDNHLYVSTIDMSLANGLGAVVRKCDTLMQPTTEKLTATNHCNGRDVWVVNHAYNSNAFYAYLVTPQGIQPPVITPVGTTHGGNLGVMMGAMKISPDGKRLALVTYEPINGRCEIFDFDNSTGRPSNPILISDVRFSGTYSLEFSPNSKRLYFNNAGEGGHRSAELYQVDLDAGNPAAVIASMTLLSAPNLTWGGLQLAPDGKIYISRTYSSQFVSIDNPNSVGPACNVNLSGANIGYTARYGLPNFNNSFFTTTYPELAGPDTVCAFQQGVVFGRDPNSCSGGGSVSYSVSGNA
ncbi:MAG TPA: M43 family zinc metalloprotease, partial [Bacteroidia bacterium]|nr:M43 family zinc metalloprotease [Bacteroidia bacterium]